MKIATRQMTWETSRGKATATITAERGIEKVEIKTSADGWVVPISHNDVICTTRVDVEVAGQRFVGMPGPDPRLPAGYVARLGSSALCLRKETLHEMTALIAEARSDAETDADWQEHIAREHRAVDADREYRDHCKKIEEAM